MRRLLRYLNASDIGPYDVLYARGKTVFNCTLDVRDCPDPPNVVVVVPQRPQAAPYYDIRQNFRATRPKIG